MVKAMCWGGQFSVNDSAKSGVGDLGMNPTIRRIYNVTKTAFDFSIFRLKCSCSKLPTIVNNATAFRALRNFEARLKQ